MDINDYADRILKAAALFGFTAFLFAEAVAAEHPSNTHAFDFLIGCAVATSMALFGFGWALIRSVMKDMSSDENNEHHASFGFKLFSLLLSLMISATILGSLMFLFIVNYEQI